MNTNKLIQIAAENVEICSEKRYFTDYNEVSVEKDLNFAIEKTKLYVGTEVFVNYKEIWKTKIYLTKETTSEAGKRLVDEDCGNPCILNFASAKNPGGGFLRGAVAQEEDLCRKSLLWACLYPQITYYKANKNLKNDFCYTDHLIYSPDVPFIRDENLYLLDEYYQLAVITSPAPNAREENKHGSGNEVKIYDTLIRRITQILNVARDNYHETLVLGAWGCGAFGNDPEEVAGIFSNLLNTKFKGVFEEVCFAIYDRSEDQKVFNVFNKFFKFEDVK